ncbi:hypothetical protein NDU88_004904 [Pleurodeles waltl]|uniref:Uncharacterized protein n=1 Tax=Pleurodeles waltl TaxID=8319 RepID=A0AAV7TTX9_PLEWA|nr:hypothetical protein NDU88_004904 [Pleurodeles waltl]
MTRDDPDGPEKGDSEALRNIVSRVLEEQACGTQPKEPEIQQSEERGPLLGHKELAITTAHGQTCHWETSGHKVIMIRKKEQRPHCQGKPDKYTRMVTFSTDDIRPQPTQTGSDNAALMQAIQSSSVSLEGGLGNVWSEISLLHQDLRNVEKRIKSAETRITDMEDTVQTLRKEVMEIHDVNKDVA